MHQDARTVVLGTNNSSRLVLHLFSALVRQYCSTRYGQLMTACSSFVQCASTIVPQYSVRTTHHSLSFICLVLLVRQYFSIQYRQLMTACSLFVQGGSTLVLQYSVRLTHLGLFFIRLVRQFVSTIVLQYSVLTTHHSLFFICLVRQQVSTVVLGTDNA